MGRKFHSFTLLPGEKIESFFDRFEELMGRMREAAQEPNEDNRVHGLRRHDDSGEYEDESADAGASAQQKLPLGACDAGEGGH